MYKRQVQKYIADKTFIFAGPKKDKKGGVILVKSIDRNCLDQILAEDSFVKANVAEYKIIDFTCSLALRDLDVV